MSYYRGRLPHWHPEDAALFITWRLHGSLPRHSEFLTNPTQTEGQRFVAIDRQLDRAPTGPTWLKDPQIAAIVKNTLLADCEKWELFDLFAWVIMANHVHVLVQPHKKPADITCTLKSASAREANRILGRQGEPFWQRESYDRWVRNKKEFDKIVAYI
jgi:putative transposase